MGGDHLHFAGGMNKNLEHKTQFCGKDAGIVVDSSTGTTAGTVCSKWNVNVSIPRPTAKKGRLA